MTCASLVTSPPTLQWGIAAPGPAHTIPPARKPKGLLVGAKETKRVPGTLTRGSGAGALCLGKAVLELHEKKNALERTLAANAGATAQLRRGRCDMEELTFTHLTWHVGTKVYLLRKVMSGAKTLTLRWGATKVRPDQMMVATGPVGYRSGTATKPRNIRVTDVSQV